MTDLDDSGNPDGWAKVEIERVSAQLSAQARDIKAEVLSAISRALVAQNLDGELDGKSPLSTVIWETVRDKLIEKTRDELIRARGGCERQPRPSTGRQRGSRSLSSFTWRYDRRTHRLTVSGEDFQRDLATIGTMVQEATLPRDLDAIVYETGGRHATVLRGRKLDRWISDTTRT